VGHLGPKLYTQAARSQCGMVTQHLWCGSHLLVLVLLSYLFSPPSSHYLPHRLPPLATRAPTCSPSCSLPTLPIHWFYVSTIHQPHVPPPIPHQMPRDVMDQRWPDRSRGERRGRRCQRRPMQGGACWYQRRLRWEAGECGGVGTFGACASGCTYIVLGPGYAVYSLGT